MKYNSKYFMYCIVVFTRIASADTLAQCQDHTHTHFYSSYGSDFYLSCDGVLYNQSLTYQDDRIEARVFCRIDRNGLFEPGKRSEAGPMEFGREIAIRIRPGTRDLNKFEIKYTLPNYGTRVAYEFRSGALVPGRIKYADSITFTPIPSLQILEYGKYWFAPKLPQIYNKPFHYNAADKPFVNKLQALPDIGNIHDQDIDMNDESVVPNARLPRYIPLNRKRPDVKIIHRRMGEHLYAGYFDQYGRFLWNSRTDPIPLKQLKQDEILKLIGVVKIGEQVYEFRSGSLIRGIINHEYYFVPEIGSTIESFRDYKQGVNPRRIYNLPGNFIEDK